MLGAGLLIGLVPAITVRRPAADADDLDGPPPRLPLLLLGVLAICTPAGVFVYAVLREHRTSSCRATFSASLPAVVVLAAWLLLRPRGALRVAAVALASVGLLVGTVKAFQVRFARPALDDMAVYMRDRAGPAATGSSRTRCRS